MNVARIKRLIPAPVRDRLRGFRWPPGLVRWLPGTSRLYGPPRRISTLHDYFSRHCGALKEIIPPHEIRLAKPVTHGDFPVRFLASSHNEAPAGRIFELGGARLIGPEGWVIAANDTWLAGAAYESADPSKPLAEYEIFHARRGLAKPLRHLAGRTLSLASDYAVGGFGHLLHDSLSRLLLIERSGMRPQDFDWVYLPRLRTPTVNKIVSSLEVPPGRLLNYDARHDLECEHLTATAFPGHPGYLSPPFAQHLRARFAPVATRNDRRVHLSRRGFRRNYTNAPEIDAILQSRGFEEVQSATAGDAVQKCAEAAFVFSLEGANFFNAAFCPAGVRVLLVFPDRLPHHLPYALSLCGALDHQVHVMAGQSIGPASLDGGEADLVIDPALLVQALDALGAHPL